MTRHLGTPLFFFALALVLVSCSAPRETATITVRPEPIASTESTSTTIPSRVSAGLALTPFPEGYEDTLPGRFDKGKMWTFDNPPIDYLEATYGFRPDSAWFQKAQRGALRFATYCSASFVSPNGLVMTNHHCARQSITAVSVGEEDLLESGFYAETLDRERAVEDLFVGQLVSIEDVTSRVYAAAEGVVGDERQADARQQRATRLADRLTNEAKAQDSTLYVQVIELYHGGKYSAYTFRRYDDVRLVMAPELQLGYFGGDPDNFTYPRYNFDMSFFRVYDAEGQPVASPDYFAWDLEGSKEGDAVFVIGNPGTTSRFNTVAQLEHERDVALPQGLSFLQSRAAILEAFIEAHPEDAETYDVRNAYFSIMNSIKSTEGQLRGLNDAQLIARRTAAERELQVALAASDSLLEQYGDVYSELEATQRAKRVTAEQQGAFAYFLNPNLSSRVVLRSFYGYVYNLLKQRGAPPDQLEAIYEDALEIEDYPAELERELIAATLRDLEQLRGADDLVVRRLLDGVTPDARADSIVTQTALLDTTGYRPLLDSGYLGSGDATVPMVNALAPLYFQFDDQADGINDREDNLNARLARARFALFGEVAPPDASFSLRLADGVVQGYTYNGTRAPAYTTFFGLYEHYHAYKARHSEWHLPDHWQTPPAGLDLRTPVNLVSTNDITGGNSGSPLLNKDLEVVGLIFDGNIESLPNEFLYTDTHARAISVDVRGMLAALEHVYEAERLAQELRTGAFD